MLDGGRYQRQLATELSSFYLHQCLMSDCWLGSHDDTGLTNADMVFATKLEPLAALPAARTMRYRAEWTGLLKCLRRKR